MIMRDLLFCGTEPDFLKKKQQRFTGGNPVIPYITTLAWTGRVEKYRQEAPYRGTILLDREGSPAPVDMEEYLIGITALQIPAEYDMEAIKAQAIIAGLISASRCREEWD